MLPLLTSAYLAPYNGMQNYFTATAVGLNNTTIFRNKLIATDASLPQPTVHKPSQYPSKDHRANRLRAWL